MINFFILNGDRKRTCTATDVDKATQILALMFPANKGYVVDNNKVVFAHNMSFDEANDAAGLRVEVPQSITVLPLAVKKATKRSLAAAVKPKKTVVDVVKAVAAKKTKLKSKVVLKNNKKPAAKKTVVKVKPKVKAKAKKPVAKVKAKKGKK